MRKLLFTSLSAATLFCASAHAAFVSTSVTGFLQFGADTSNYFDPVYDFVPNGYLNSAGTTVTISSSVPEFGYDDRTNLFTADFTDNQLIVSELVETSGPNLPFMMTFADAALTGLSIGTASGSFPLSYSLGGDLLIIRGTGGNVGSGQTFAETFNFIPAPEPSTEGLLLFSGLAITAVVLARAKVDCKS